MPALSGPDFLKKLDTDLEPLRVELTSSKIVRPGATASCRASRSSRS